jgi:hypothetical protein
MHTTCYIHKSYAYNLSLKKNCTHKLLFKQLCIQIVWMNSMCHQTYTYKLSIKNLSLEVIRQVMSTNCEKKIKRSGDGTGRSDGSLNRKPLAAVVFIRCTCTHHRRVTCSLVPTRPPKVMISVIQNAEFH